MLKPTDWHSLTGWTDDDIQPAWEAFLRSCAVLKNKPLWQGTCIEAESIQAPDSVALRQFIESRFVPHQVLNPDGGGEGLITGYYEPLLKGSRKQSKRFRYPLYTTPDELLVIDLGEVCPELKNMPIARTFTGTKRLSINCLRATLSGTCIDSASMQVPCHSGLFFRTAQLRRKASHAG